MPVADLASFSLNAGRIKRHISHSTYGKANTMPATNDTYKWLENWPEMSVLIRLISVLAIHMASLPITSCENRHINLKVIKSELFGARSTSSKISCMYIKAAIANTSIAKADRIRCQRRTSKCCRNDISAPEPSSFSSFCAIKRGKGNE